MLKNKFTLPVIALILMLIAFIYFYLDLTDIKNTYKQDVQVSAAAKQEAEIAVLFTNIKRDLQISYLTTLKKEFDWKTAENTLKISGWGFSGDTNISLYDSIITYFKDEKFKEDVLNSTSSNIDSSGNSDNIRTLGYQRDDLVCMFTSSSLDTRISIYCGFIK